ncbi:hypothetical protein [Pedococcus sp. P5_B7]
MKEKWIGRARATPSGTRVVLVVLAFLVVSTVGRAMAEWDQITHSSSAAAGALLSVVVPFAALLWGVRSAASAANVPRKSVSRR